MTRKLGLATLLTVLTVLLICGLFSYLTVRSILISDFDRLLFERAAGLPDLYQGQYANKLDNVQYDWSDSFEIRNEAGEATAAQSNRQLSPTLESAYFSRDAHGRLQRTVVVRALSNDTRKPITVTYSGYADHIAAVLHRLALWLITFGVCGGLVTTAVAFFIVRRSLRPLHDTAKLISSINEQRLGRRATSATLSPELAPIADGLNDMLKRLESAFAQKRQLLADASQQLTEPVAALLTTIQAAMEDSQTENHREVLKTCLPQLQILRRLVGRLLEQVHSELSAEDSRELTDVSALLNEKCDCAAEFAAARSIEVVRAIPGDLKCEISPRRLQSIVANLLANAVEYTPPGGKVGISCLHDGSKLRVRISDNGPGIAEGNLARLFQPFDRLDRGSDPQHLGLGLFLVQSHVRAMEGSIRVDGGSGQGTAVEVELPCARVEAISEELTASVLA
jgi:signal transduction histidine kinase